MLYVLDGQQRLTSLYAAAKGAKVHRDGGRTDDFANLWVDLTADDGAALGDAGRPVVTHEPHGTPGHDCISVTHLLTAGLTQLNAFPPETHERLETYKSRLNNYQFSTITIAEVPLDVATDVFTRLNVGGVTLTPIEIMVAKSYRPPTDDVDEFDLSREYDALRGRLAEIEFETVQPMVLLYLTAALAAGDCRKKTLLNLPRDLFIENWHLAVDGIEHAIDHLRTAYRIPASRLLPYNSLLVVLGYYFARKPGKPSRKHAEWLRDFFFRASLTARYTGPVETNLTQDLAHITSILNNERPRLGSEFALNPTPRLIDESGDFRTSRAFIKAILCLLAARGPRSFDDGNPVRVDNDWLKQANSKNYHHFFPRAFLAKRGDQPERRINHIANITIVDDYLNKRTIRARPPSDYMSQFQAENPNLDETMQSHLIPDLTSFGVWEDDYANFYRKRCAEIAHEIKAQLLPLPDDKAAVSRRTMDDETDEPE